MKIRINKIHILIAAYVFALIMELFCFVPYEKIEVFRSEQNVPHTEIIGSGYTNIVDIGKDDATVEGNAWTAIGKITDTPQLAINVSCTTLIFIAVYFLFLYKKKRPAENTASPTESKQISLFDMWDEDAPEEITTHIVSTQNGYYKDVTERTEENSALIDKWIDKNTGCLYMVVMYKNEDAESMLVTKEFFETVRKQFDL